MWNFICVFGVTVSIAGSDERRRDLKPFAVLDKTTASLRGKSVMTLAAPSLLDDFCKRRHKSCVILTKENWAYVLLLFLCLKDKASVILQFFPTVPLKKNKKHLMLLFWLMNIEIIENHMLHGKPSAKCSFWLWQINSWFQQKQKELELWNV